MADENRKFPNGWGSNEDEDEDDENSAWGSDSFPFKKDELLSDEEKSTDNFSVQKSSVNELKQSYNSPQPAPRTTTPNNSGYVVQKQKTSPILIVVIIALVIIIGVLVGLFFMITKSKKNDNLIESSSVSDVESTTVSVAESITESSNSLDEKSKLEVMEVMNGYCNITL